MNSSNHDIHKLELPYKIKISIIIPYHQEKRHLSSCLDSIQTSNYKDFEVIIIDDASSEKLNIDKTYPFPLQIIHNKRNRGGGYTRNQGVKKAQGELLLFIDADIIIYKETLSLIKKSFSENPDLSALIGSYTQHTPYEEKITNFKNLFHYYHHQKANSQAATFWTGCGAIKKEIFLQIGEFSENPRITPIEDIDLGYRLHKKNFKILLQKNIFVTHLKQYSFLNFIKNEIFFRALPWTYIIFKEKIIKDDLNTSQSSFFSIIISLFILLSIITLPYIFYPSLLTIFFSFILLIYINRNFYALALNLNGRSFLFYSLFFSWVHFICCSLGFILGSLLFLTDLISETKNENNRTR